MVTKTYSLHARSLINKSGGGLTAHDANNFEVSVQAFVQALNLNFATVLKATAIELRNRIMRGNPVDTGRSRDSWQLTVGSPSTWAPAKPWKDTDTRGKNWPPPPPDAYLASLIDGKKPIFIVSNVDYVFWLEQGSSGQAPLGFVRIAAQSVAAEMDAITKRALAGETFTFAANAGSYSSSSPAAHGPKMRYK